MFLHPSSLPLFKLRRNAIIEPSPIFTFFLRDLTTLDVQLLLKLTNATASKPRKKLISKPSEPIDHRHWPKSPLGHLNFIIMFATLVAAGRLYSFLPRKVSFVFSSSPLLFIFLPLASSSFSMRFLMSSTWPDTLSFPFAWIFFIGQFSFFFRL